MYKKFSRRKEIQQYKRIVFYHYSGLHPHCNCCGEDIYEFLTVDHINNDGFLDKKSRRNLYYNIIKNNFPNTFQILCWNCNEGKNIDKNHICPHKKEKNKCQIQ